jgi:hypothetical protein
LAQPTEIGFCLRLAYHPLSLAPNAKGLPESIGQEFPCDIFAIPKAFPAYQIRDAE